MLPEGFEWTPRYQHAKDELALQVDGRVVAQLMQRVDGTWFARLWAQAGIEAPLVMRDCQSFKTGKAGIEAWACRHEERLRREVQAR
jgi:hypothetical protein